MYSLLKSRGFVFPRVDDSEINALLSHEQIQVKLRFVSIINRVGFRRLVKVQRK